MPFDLAHGLSELKAANLLTQDNFGRLIHPQNNVLHTLRIGGGIIWDRIPRHLLTQDTFEQLIACALLENPVIQIEQYINNLLGRNDEWLNNRQSTHTASIHNSISASATKLWAYYAKELTVSKIEEIITRIKTDISNLPDTVVNKAAKRCIKRITQDIYSFTDPVSKITLRQLLVLSYLGIHDDEKRLGHREDAYKQFIDGLYEIQRGYNLSAEGIDNEQADLPVCTAGTFNKLMEKLSGIHPDVELLFITKETATLKLPIIVREELKNYLEKLSKPETTVGFHYFIKLLQQLLENGIDIVWSKIKPQVADRLFDEFKSIYQDNRENLDFLDLVESGQYIEIKKGNLSGYQQEMLSSIGYRKYCSQIVQNNFFSEKRDYLSDQQPEDIKKFRKF